jgi:hypothetical protein
MAVSPDKRVARSRRQGECTGKLQLRNGTRFDQPPDEATFSVPGKDVADRGPMWRAQTPAARLPYCGTMRFPGTDARAPQRLRQRFPRFPRITQPSGTPR